MHFRLEANIYGYFWFLICAVGHWVKVPVYWHPIKVHYGDIRKRSMLYTNESVIEDTKSLKCVSGLPYKYTALDKTIDNNYV